MQKFFELSLLCLRPQFLPILHDNFKKRVWLYDGNIEFLTGKHIPLFILTLLLLILLSISYTLSLISIQWLQRISHYRLLSRVVIDTTARYSYIEHNNATIGYIFTSI